MSGRPEQPEGGRRRRRVRSDRDSDGTAADPSVGDRPTGEQTAPAHREPANDSAEQRKTKVSAEDSKDSATPPERPATKANRAGAGKAGRQKSPKAQQGDGGRGADAGLRGLVGAGPTQLPPTTAMRARDASQPTAEDIAAAERDLTIVRRNWSPPPDS